MPLYPTAKISSEALPQIFSKYSLTPVIVVVGVVVVVSLGEGVDVPVIVVVVEVDPVQEKRDKLIAIRLIITI